MDETDRPTLLYHYTTQEGLIGILEKKSIWATKAMYLNDASELSKPLSYIETALRNGKHELIKNKLKEKYFYRDDFSVFRSINTCVASFCTDGDLLSQWRGYGSYGLAYAIGFDANLLEEDAELAGFKLSKCRYFNEEEYKDEIDRFLASIEVEQKEDPSYFGSLFGSIILKAATMKNKCFNEENEWRIISKNPVAYNDPKLKFRAGKSMIIPYCDIPINESSIVKIVIGPCQNPDLTKLAVGGLSIKLQISKIAANNDNITISRIPYRVL